MFELCVGDDGDGDVRVACVSEFVLTHPCLSMTVLDAGRRRLRSAATAGGDGDEDDGAIGDMTTGRWGDGGGGWGVGGVSGGWWFEADRWKGG